jgi:uncharacterized membrane protein
MLAGIKSNSELRALARQQLKGNWGKAILAVVIYLVITGIISRVSTDDVFGWILGILVFVLTGAWSAGILNYFVHLIRKQPLSPKLLFSQLQRLFPFFLLYLLIAIFIVLWTLLLIIPGIIASIRYSLAFYVLIDHPEMTALEAINRSKEMMEGHKMKYFLLLLSFIGWYLLCFVTLGIGFLWFIPYVYATQAAFYEELRTHYEEQNNQSI